MTDDREHVKVLARLHRIEGQIRGISKMVEDSRLCEDVLAQTSSAIAALRGVEDIVLSEHLRSSFQSVLEGDGNGKAEAIRHAIDVVSKFRRRD